MDSTRRDFIRQISLACGSIMFIPACSGYDSVWRFFTEQEAKNCNRIRRTNHPG